MKDADIVLRYSLEQKEHIEYVRLGFIKESSLELSRMNTNEDYTKALNDILSIIEHAIR